jgi:O-antigen/teichoic acid export membrane protein
VRAASSEDAIDLPDGQTALHGSSGGMIQTVTHKDLESQYFLNLASQAVGRAVSFGANFLAFVIISRIAGIEFFGKYSYVLAFLGIFSAIADSGMCSVLGKGITQAGKSASLYWGNFLILRIALSLAVIPVGIIAAFYISRDLFPVLLIGLFAIPFLAARFFEPIFQVYRRPWHSTYSSMAYGVSYFFLFSSILICTKSLILIVTAFIVANTIYGVVAFSLAQKSLRPTFAVDLPIMKSIFKLMAPLGVSSLFVILTGRLPILMLAAMKSDHAVAIFNAAYRFVELSALLSAALSGPLIPVFSARALKGPDLLKKMFVPLIELVAIFAFPVAIIIPALSGPLIALLFGQAFAESAQVLNILAWVCVVLFYSLFSSAAAIAIGSVKYAYWSGASAALLCVGFNYLLIPRYGFLGTAWIALFCEVFLAGITLCYVMRYLGNIFRWERWAKIIGLNVLLYIMLNMILPGLNLLPRIGLSVAVYGGLVMILRIIPTDLLLLFTEMQGKPDEDDFTVRAGDALVTHGRAVDTSAPRSKKGSEARSP